MGLTAEIHCGFNCCSLYFLSTPTTILDSKKCTQLLLSTLVCPIYVYLVPSFPCRLIWNGSIIGKFRRSRSASMAFQATTMFEFIDFNFNPSEFHRH